MRLLVGPEPGFGVQFVQGVLMFLLLGIAVSAMGMTIRALRRGNGGDGDV